MTGVDRIGAIQEVGRRARAWRADQNWGGEEAAEYLSERLDRQVTWRTIRSIERGNALPDVELAEQLAALYGRDLGDLLGLMVRVGESRIAAATAATAPWPPRAAEPDEVADLAGWFVDRGLDGAFAERFFRLGVSAKLARKWCREFDADVACRWLALRIGLRAAIRWRDLGLTAEQACWATVAGYGPDTVDATVMQSLPGPASGGDAGALVDRMWTTCEADRATRDRWVGAGWDPLSSLAWFVRDFEPEDASRWAAGGFDPVVASKWRDGGFASTEVHEWAGMSLRRARLLMTRGITRADVERRRLEGEQTLVAARAEIQAGSRRRRPKSTMPDASNRSAGEPDPADEPSMGLSTRHRSSTSICDACGQAPGPNDRCGCS